MFELSDDVACTPTAFVAVEVDVAPCPVVWDCDGVLDGDFDEHGSLPDDAVCGMWLSHCLISVEAQSWLSCWPEVAF